MKLHEILNIKYPIIQGGMANISRGEFAGQISNLGALGVIGSGSMNSLELKREIEICREHTKKPFGVNLMLLNPDMDKIAQLVCDMGVKVVTTGAGNPAKYLKLWQEAGIKVFPVVASVSLARRMEGLGVDGIIVEGMEAGGHIGEMTTMTLVAEVSRRVKLPVIAAGGIGSGKQMLAAEVLGASGVQIGTLFLSSEECPIHENYKEKLVTLSSSNITVIGKTTGLPVRLIKNPMARDYTRLERNKTSKMDLEAFTLGSLSRAVRDGDFRSGSFMAGLSIDNIEKIRPAKEILEDLEAEYLEELEKIKNGK